MKVPIFVVLCFVLGVLFTHTATAIDIVAAPEQVRWDRIDVVEGNEAVVTFNGVNRFPVPVFIRIHEVNKATNEITLLTSKLIPANAAQAVYRILAEYIPKTHEYRYSIVVGDPKAKHDPSTNYRVPFGLQEKFYVSQGFHGEFSHDYPGGIYAIDIAMPTGSNIHAAREGIVLDKSVKFTEGAPSYIFGDQVNFVEILHSDGTIAIYAHLKMDAVFVTIGEEVRRGDVIGRSGNSGYSTGPHLHFAIVVASKEGNVAVPFAFVGPSQSVVIPETGVELTAH